MLKVGLTGGIGSGKTAVSNLFNSLGVLVIDTDIIAHDILTNNQEVIQEITGYFGHSVLDNNKTIDRKKLAKIAFDDSDKKKQLEKILHPKIRQAAIQQMDLDQSQENSANKNYLIIVVPLLLETDFHTLVDQILVVTADEEKRIDRIQRRDSRSIEEIHSIINQQMKEKKRLEAADDVIVNNGNILNLASQIEILDKKYARLAEANE